jgi:serine acetyltransferase
VVSKDVRSAAIVGGCPAEIIGERETRPGETINHDRLVSPQHSSAR